MGDAVAAVGQIPSFDRGAKGRLDEFDRGCDRPRPEGSDSRQVLNLGSISGEAVFLDQVASELGETKTLGITLKGRSEGSSKVSTAPDAGRSLPGQRGRPRAPADAHARDDPQRRSTDR